MKNPHAVALGRRERGILKIKFPPVNGEMPEPVITIMLTDED